MELLARPVGDWPSKTFLQSPFWARFKARHGWTSHGFILEGTICGQTFGDPASGQRVEVPLSVLCRPLFGPVGFAYVPHGPELALPPAMQGPFLAAAAKALKPHLGKACVFIRFDPPWHEPETTPGQVTRPRYGKPLRKGSDVQPPDTVALDLRLSEEDILAGMKNKWRYNIRLAAKKGVIVADEGQPSLDEFLELYAATASRDGIALHGDAYYRSLFESARAERDGKSAVKPELRLWVARHDGQALASIVTLFYGHRATYLYGASSDSYRNLMPAYALQWAAMLAAKAAGCTDYDLYGIPPNDDPTHPMAGLYRFKTGFGGSILHYAGAWDYAYQPILYWPYRLLEGLRLFWFKRAKKIMTRRKARPAKGLSAQERNDDER